MKANEVVAATRDAMKAATSNQPKVKLSIRVPSELAHAVRKRVGSRGLSEFVARALQHELEPEGVRTLVEELEKTLGPPSKSEMARARRAWPKR